MNFNMHTILVWLIRLTGLIIICYGIFILNTSIKDGFEWSFISEDIIGLIYVLIGGLFLYNAFLFKRLKKKE